jgi:hypothetical protein
MRTLVNNPLFTMLDYSGMLEEIDEVEEDEED